MEMKPVESSNIAAIGFEDGMIRIQFRDGKLYQQAAAQTVFDALLAASSKGKFVREHLAGLERFADGGPAPAGVPYLVGESTTEQTAPRLTEMHEPDECCGKHLGKALRSGVAGPEWECPACGTTWRGRTITEASVRNWEPVCDIQILRPNG